MYSLKIMAGKLGWIGCKDSIPSLASDMVNFKIPARKINMRKLCKFLKDYGWKIGLDWLYYSPDKSL